jgi:trimeric autotransporter adhesin
MLKYRQLTSNHQGQKSTAFKTKSWVKLALVLGLATTGNALYVLPLIAASPAGGTTIENQATGTFTDGDDPTNTIQEVQSNVVTLTVAEVAGVSVGAEIPAEAPSNVTGAGSYQSFPGIHSGDVVYFDFTITNVGNDPTKFVIPSTATVVGGGTVGQLQIIGYDSLVFDGVGGNPAPVNVPTTFDANTNSTGTLLATTAGVNGGSVNAGGTIKVRVPVTITASAGSNVTVMLGNSPIDSTSTATPADRLQNQTYINNTNTDVYTVDNANPATAGTPSGSQEVIGSPANGTREASAIAQVTVLGKDISGNVFEDINYGGGAGRSKTAASGAGVDGARVELYDSSGKFIRSTLTTGGGNYTFPGVPVGDFYIRTVNSTVTSTRSSTNSGLLPVQTFVTDAGVTANTVSPVVNKVGGEVPSQVDAGNGGSGAIFDPVTGRFTTAGGSVATGEYIQSLTKVKVDNLPVTGLDFGYNFDTIVNTNNAGQGSLRQFILNSNALPNTNLNQVGQTSGQEVSIFMIPNGNSNAGQQSGLLNQVAGTANNNGAAVITLLSPLDAVTDRNTTISGFTQTTNIGDSNPGQIGSGVGVGISNQLVPKTDRPEIVIDGRNLTDSTNADQYAITLNGDYAILKGVAVYGTKGNYATAIASDSGAVRVGSTNGSNVSVAGAALIEQNLIGTFADGSDPGASLQNQRYGTICFAACEIKNNFIAYNGYGTVLYNTGADGSKITGNEYQSNGANVAPNSGQQSAEGDSVALWSVSNALVAGNLIANTRAVGSNTLDSGKGIELVSTFAAPTSNNLIQNNTIENSSTAGIGLYNNTSDNTIFRNIIKDTNPLSNAAYAGAGILLSASSSTLPATITTVTPVRNTISENSIYDNAGLGIDLDPRSWLLGDGVTANNGTTSATIPNTGTDYPVITLSRLSAGNLIVKGFIGSQSNGSTTFAGNKLEFFVADNTPANQNGEVILGDGKSRPHGEGRTYIGSCTADANGLFDCSFPTTITNAIDITATATDSNGNTSEFSSVALNNPNVLLVKRITNVNGSTSTLNGQNLDEYIDESSNPYDDNSLSTPAISPPDTNQWPTPATFLIGGTNGGNVRPGDMLEYTIYFLSNGDGVANNVSICDLIPEKQTFVPSIATWLGTVPTLTPAAGSAGGDRGIVAQANDQLKSYTNLADGDSARYYPPGTTLPNACRPSPTAPIPTNTNGAVVVDLGTVVNPTNATLTDKPYGFMRFRTRVN